MQKKSATQARREREREAGGQQRNKKQNKKRKQKKSRERRLKGPRVQRLICISRVQSYGRQKKKLKSKEETFPSATRVFSFLFPFLFLFFFLFFSFELHLGRSPAISSPTLRKRVVAPRARKKEAALRVAW
jgi:hypothetical protein